MTDRETRDDDRNPNGLDVNTYQRLRREGKFANLRCPRCDTLLLATTWTADMRVLIRCRNCGDFSHLIAIAVPVSASLLGNKPADGKKPILQKAASI